MSKLDRCPSQRQCDFLEVTASYTLEQAREEASRCLDCKHKPCVSGCPVGINIPAFIAPIKSGDLDGACRILYQYTSLPSICGRVCPQERQCQKHCVRGIKGQPVEIGRLERLVGDHALSHSQTQPSPAKLGKRVALVGSGPASLTCADELLKAGVDVVIFEALHLAGGVLSYGIPEFRLPKAIVAKQIDRLIRRGARLETNVVIGKTISITQLLEEFDAVFVGSGAGLPMFLGIEGEHLLGVFSANEVLTRVNLMGAYQPNSDTPIYRGKRVVVVGAGNVAMDAARTARRLGGQVSIVYRRDRASMPARAEEIAHAEEEGIEFCLLRSPKQILGDQNGWVRAIVCQKNKLAQPGADGRSQIVPTEGEQTIECDSVIVAVGTSPNPIIADSLPLLMTTERGTLVTDDDLRTSVAGVYAGGDAVSGSATVILAMGAGQRAAKTILADLQSKN